MKTRSLLVRFLAAISLTLALSAGQLGAQVTTFNDATNDISTNIAGGNPGGGTLDIVKMEVVDTETDVVFTMTVNGNITAVNWGNFMVGIANQKANGTTAANGNGWNRPISLNIGGGKGMTHWIGSWVNSGGGSQLWTYADATTNWSGPVALAGFNFEAGAQSTITYTVSKESLGVTNGDTIIFDAYSSGAEGNPSAVDALANTNVSISDWGGPYTSVAPTLTKSYTLANTASPITNTVTFSVDMSAQISVGAFDPLFDTVSVAGSFNGFNPAANILSEIGGGIYQATIPVVAGSGTIVGYRYVIDSGLFEAENLTRTFPVGTDPDPAPLVIPTVFFNNIDGYRDVTFTVDMSEQQTLGTFDPATQTVEVRGAFNNWAGTALTAQGSGIYSGTLTIGGAPDQLEEYKFYVAGTDALGYEAGDNRTFNLAFNPDGSPTPALDLSAVSFRAAQLRQVTFSVDMGVQQALGLFNPATGTVELRSGSFGEGDARTLTREGETAVYSGTFAIPGSEGTTFQYKFWSPGINFYNVPDNTGFEQINLADQYQNRSITLSANGVAMNLDTVFFSNQLFFITGAPLSAFTTIEGTPSAPQSLTVNGQGLTADITATAPASFEVSSDGITYGPTATITPVSGAVTGATLSVRLAASAVLGSPSGNVTLTSPGSQPASTPVSGTVNNPTTVVTASDNAANYVGGWTNGANAGSGFGAWNVVASSGTNTNTPGFAGAFIGDPANAGITNFGSSAFGLYANPNGSGAYVDVSRSFPVLQVGQTFSFQWAVNFDSEGGNKGFNVFGGGQQVVNVNQGSFPGDIVVNIGTNSINTSNTITYGTNPMTWSFTRTAADNLQVTATGRDGTTNIAFSTNVAITTGPDTAAWYAADMGAGDQRQPFFNNLQISGPPLVTNQVTFSVDMSAQIDAQTFDPATGVVEVRGEFNGFAGGDVLTPVADGVYRGTFAISGTTGTPVFYKFWATGLDYEGGSNRSFTLGTAGEEQNLLTVPFTGGLPLETRDVNFSVDMSVQIALGNFIPAGGVVEVRGPFNGWNGTALTAQGAGIYSGTVSVPGAAGETEQYKFWATGLDYEVVDPNDPFVNRTFVLGPSGDLQILDTVFFSNQTSAGETFANWSGGQPLTPALELEYAIGGASAPGAGDGVPSVTTLTPSTLSITAVVRTNDPTLTVNGQSLINLAVGPWTTNNVTVTVVDPQPDNVPAGCEVQTFSTPRGTDGRNFLRLQTTLPAQP